MDNNSNELLRGPRDCHSDLNPDPNLAHHLDHYPILDSNSNLPRYLDDDAIRNDNQYVNSHDDLHDLGLSCSIERDGLCGSFWTIHELCNPIRYL